MSESEVIGGLEIEFLINNPQILAALMQTEGYFERSQRSIQSTVNTTSSEIESFAKRAAATAAGYFSLQAAKNFVQELVNVRGEFEQIQIAYQTILKSKEKGDALFAETVKLAATTPFNLTEVAQSTKQLLAYGFGAKEVTDVLTTLGNVAAGVSAPIGDIAYLYGTLKTQGRAYAQDIRQFTGRGIPIIAELAKQFGVTNDQVNKLVEQGKVGFPEIEKAFKSLTGAGGIFYNLMEKQSKTLTGQLSNLGDAFSQMLNDLGKGNNDLLSGGIQAASAVVANYQRILDIIEELIIVYGVYKAVVIATTAVNALQTAGLAQFTAAQLLQYGALSALTSAQVALNSAQAIALINTGAITAAVAILVFAVRALSAEYEHTHIAEQQLAEIRATGLKGLQDEKLKVSELVNVIKDHNSSNDDRAKAISKLNALNPEFLGGLTQQNVLTQQGTDAINKYLDALEKKLEGEAAYQQKLENLKKVNDIKSRGYDALSTTEEAGAILTDFFTGGVFKGGDAKTRVLNDYMKSYIDANTKISEQFKAQLKKVLIGDEPEQISAAVARAKKFAEDLKEPIKNFDALIKEVSNKADAESINKALQDKLDALAPGDKQIEAIKTKLVTLKKVLDTYSIKADQKAAADADSEQKRRNKIYDDVAKLNEAAHQNQLTADQKEVEQAKAKYEAILKEIDRFNHDKRNKTKIDPTKVKINGVVTDIPKAEQNAADDVVAKQQVEKQKAVFEQQKILFDAFEKYKLEAGETAANELYGKDLQGYKTYIEYLNSFKPKESDVSASANAMRDLLAKMIPEANKDQAKRLADQYANLLLQTQSYEEKRAVITELYMAKRATLIKNGKIDEVRTLDTQYTEEIDALGEANFKKLAVYKELFDGITVLTKKQAQDDIALLKKNLDDRYKAGTISKEAYLRLKKELNSATVSINKDLPSDLNAAASALSNVAGSLSQINPELSNVIGGLSNVLSGTSSIIANLGTLKDSASSFAQKFSAGAGLIGTAVSLGVSLVSGIVSLFDDSKAKAEQQKLNIELQQKATEAVNKALERQISLTKQLYGTDRITSYIKTLNDLASAQKDVQNQINSKLQLSDNAQINKLITKANEGSINDFEKNLLQQAINAGAVFNLAGKSLEDLQKLLDSGKLDASASTLVQSLAAIKQQITDTQNALKAEFTGTEFGSIVDHIVQMFKEGKTAAADFADNFKSLMQDAILKAFETKYLETQLQGFYDQFADAFQYGAADAATIAKLQAAYDDIIKKAQAEFLALQGITGEPFDPSTSADNSLAGKISGITADQADLLSGITHGIQLAVLESNTYTKDTNNTQKAQLAEMRAQTLVQRQIEANTRRAADSIDNDVTPALNKIANNTAGSLGADQRAAGFFGY